MDESGSIDAELQEASSVLKKAKQQLEDSTNEVNAARLALSRIEGAVTMKPRDLERAKHKYQTASDKLSIARASYRQCDEVCRALQQKVHTVDVPRITRILSSLESARGQEARQTLQSAMRLDRVAAEMDVQCAALMEAKVGDVVLEDVLDSLMTVNQPLAPGQVLLHDSSHPYAYFQSPPITPLGSPGDDTRHHYSITMPLSSRAAALSPTSPTTLSTPLVDRSAVAGGRTDGGRANLTLNPSPSYYPSAQHCGSSEMLDAKRPVSSKNASAIL